MATHSSILAWRIPWTEEPSWLQSMGLQRVGHDWATSPSPVWMWEFDYKAERRRIDAFELWCWRRLLTVPWTARRSNQSILKEISPGVHWKDWCWSWNSNTLATWCEQLTCWKRPWCLERLRAGGEGTTEDKMLDGITDSMNMSGHE